MEFLLLGGHRQSIDAGCDRPGHRCRAQTIVVDSRWFDSGRSRPLPGRFFPSRGRGGYCTVWACSPSIDCIYRPVACGGPMGRPARFIRRCRQTRCTAARDRAVRWRSPNPESNTLGRHLGRWDAQPASMGQAHGRGGDTEHVPLGFLTTSAARPTWLPVADSTRHLAAGNAVAGWSTAQRLNSFPHDWRRAACFAAQTSIRQRSESHSRSRPGPGRYARSAYIASYLSALGSRYRPVRTRFRQ